MEFDLSDDQRTFNEQVDRFLRDTCPVDRLHKAFDGDADLSATVWQGMLELGLGGIVVPEAQGGLGLGLLEASSISERIGWAGAPGPWISHTLAAYAIAQAGSDAQKEQWLTRFASGEATGSIALMEGDAWQADQWSLPADDRSSGTKDYVIGVDQADVFVVGLAGGGLGLVEKNAAGLKHTAWATTDRTRPVGQLQLNNTPVSLMPGTLGSKLVDAALVLIASDAHGGAMRALEDIVEYSKERVQFDRPIARFQAVKHKLADLALSIEPNGALCRQAAATVDQEPEDASLVASRAKAHVTDVFAHVARTATESYGGIGYTWEHWAHIWLRRAMFDYAWLGAPMAHRSRAADLSDW